MAFDATALVLQVDSVAGGGIRIYTYQTSDNIDVVLDEGYLHGAVKRGLRLGDIIIVQIDDNANHICTVSSFNALGNGTLTQDDGVTAEMEALLAQAIAARDAAIAAAAEAAASAVLADERADAAAVSANDANNSKLLADADAAATAADVIQTGLDVAEAEAAATLAGTYAAAAVLTVTSIYADTTAGLAASSDLAYFYTLSSTPYVFLDLYQEVSGIAILKDSIANKDAFDAVFDLATTITISGLDKEVDIHGTRLVPVDDDYAEEWSYPFFDSQWRLLGGILTDGEWQWGEGHKTFSYRESDWRSGSQMPVIDSEGYWLSWYNSYNGRFNAILSSDTLRQSGELADVDPQTLIDLGARGMPYEARLGPGNFYKFKSTCAVGPLIMRSDLDDRATMYNTTRDIPIHVGYGQSWRQQGTRTIAEMILNADHEQEAVITLCNIHNGVANPIPSSAGINYPTEIGDLCGISADLNVNIDRVAMIARHRMRLRGRNPVGPMLFWTGGYPGSTLYVGGDDGLGLGPTGNVWARNVQLMTDAEREIQRWPNDLVYGDDALKEVGVKSMGWTQAGTNASTQENVDDFTNVLIPMCASIGITNLYIGVNGGRYDTLEWPTGSRGKVQLLETYDNDNPISGVRVYESCCWYPLQLAPGDEIHFDDPGIVIYGELEAYARYRVEDCGETHFKLCHITEVEDAAQITVDGQTVTVWIDRPTPPEFANSRLVADTVLSPEVPFYGFRAKLNGVDIDLIGDVTLGVDTQSGIDDVEFLTATFDVVEDLSGGGTLTIGYATKGDAVDVVGGWSPIHGNIVCPGPLSVVRKDRANATLDVPLRHFEKDVTL